MKTLKQIVHKSKDTEKDNLKKMQLVIYSELKDRGMEGLVKAIEDQRKTRNFVSELGPKPARGTLPAGEANQLENELQDTEQLLEGAEQVEGANGPVANHAEYYNENDH